MNQNIWKQLDSLYREEKIQEGLEIINKKAQHVDISKPIDNDKLDWWRDEPDIYDDKVRPVMIYSTTSVIPLLN